MVKYKLFLDFIVYILNISQRDPKLCGSLLILLGFVLWKINSSAVLPVFQLSIQCCVNGGNSFCKIWGNIVCLPFICVKSHFWA